MTPTAPLRLRWLAAGTLALATLAAARAGEPARPQVVTVYRCADSRGQLVALRDTPCLPGERQQVLEMQRPVDPPPAPARPVATPAPAAAPAPAREVRTVVVQPPQPMYECTSADGKAYTSDSNEGNPRWVPFWVPLAVARMPPRPGVLPSPGPAPTPAPAPPPGPGPRPPHGPGSGPWHGHGAPLVAAGGTWVRDSCVRIPQAEVCKRLSDRHYEILRVYHAASPSQRQALDREQAQLDERLRNDCRGG